MVAGLQVVRRTEPEPLPGDHHFQRRLKAREGLLDPFRAVASFSFVHQLSIVL